MSSMGSNRVVPLQVLRTLERYASEEKPLSSRWEEAGWTRTRWIRS